MSCGRRCSEAILKCEGHSGAGAHHNHTWAATKSVRNTNTQKETNITEDKTQIQFTTSSRRLDGGAYCGAPVGGKCMVSKAKLVLYAFAV